MDFTTELAERQIDNKDKNIPEIVIYELREIQKHYDENLELVCAQFFIADELVASGNIKAAETIWRTQVVLLASAYDYFMHEIIWYGLYQMFVGAWGKSEEYMKLTITFQQLEEIQSEPESQEWFKTLITKKYSIDTMMSFDALKKNMKLLNIKIQNIADAAFYERNGTIKTIKQLETKLDAVYYHRNCIAHQSDRLHENAEQKAITKEEVETFVDNIKRIVNAVISEVKRI